VSLAIPDTPLGKHLAWAIAMLEGETPTIAEVKKRLAPAFLAAVPAEMFVRVAPQMTAALDGFEATRFERGPSETEAVVVLETPNGSAFRLSIAIEPGKTGRIAGLQMEMADDLRKEPLAKSWADVERVLRGMAARVNFLAAEVVGTDVSPIHGLNEDLPLAIGSTFKLYILGALANAVAAGDIAWDDELAIKAALKSIPSGELQNAKAGAKFDVATFATKMISISDNTATDHLLLELGREAVEAVQREMGHSDPSLNVPFLLTREMAVLKLGATPAVVKSYLAADADGRRKVLDTKITKAKLPKITNPQGWDKPKHIDEIEWFASASDLGRAMAWLRAASGRKGLEEVAKVLSVNPGIQFDRYAWTYIGFKGGGEPGVVNMTFLLKRLDDRWFVMSCALNDDEKNPDVTQLVSLLHAAAALLVMHRKKPKKPKKSGR
jgi:beta-lactamase class A